MSATRTIRTLVIATVTAATLCVVPALGQQGPPFDPPGWWGDQGGTTISIGFTFSNNSNPPQPDAQGSYTPSWYEGTMFHISGDVQWYDQLGGRQGVWGVSGRNKVGDFIITVDNEASPASVKKVFLQFDTYTSQAGIGWGLAVPDGCTRTTTSRDVQTLPDGWVRHTYEYEIDPQPAWEVFHARLATAESGGTVAIDNVSISTQCELRDPDGAAENFPFDIPVWPPVAMFRNVPEWHDDTEWDRYGSAEPDWMPAVTDHEGVIGLQGGTGIPAEGVLAAHFDDLQEPAGTKHVRCQFDCYMAEGGMIGWSEEAPGSIIENRQEDVQPMENGWLRVIITFDVTPPPDGEIFSWHMVADPFGGPVAIDNVSLCTTAREASGPPMMSGATESAEPLSVRPVPAGYSENFDSYPLGSGLHGQGGWKGWDNDPAFDAFVKDAQANSAPNSVDVSADTDIVHEFDGCDSGKWMFTAYQYIPSDFSSNSGAFDPGTYFLLLNTYDDGGPYNWSVQMVFDSDSGMAKVSYGNGHDTIDVPYSPDRWVQIKAIVDLDNDLTQVYYDEALIAEYSWTGGIYGGGGGALDIAAVDLFANGSSSVYYDDLSLRKVSGR